MPNPALISTQKFLVKNRTLIERLFLFAEISIVGFIIFVGFQVNAGSMTMGDAHEFGETMGTIALFFYCLSLIPGMMSRFKFQPLIGAMLMQFRRHFGIMMFMATFAHFAFMSLFWELFTEYGIPQDPTRTAGFIGYMIAIPLWFTSNDVATKLLGKWWKWLHRLTYVILLAVFAHLSLMNSNYAVIAAAFILLELLSWAFFWKNKLFSAPKNATTVQSSSSNDSTTA